MKAKLHSLIAAARAKEEEVLVPRVDDAEPPVAGQWTAKDQLAHLTAWRVVAADELDAIRTGGHGPDISLEDDVANAKFYSETHAEPATKIIRAARASWDWLAGAIDASTDEDLLRPRLRRPDQPAWQTVPNNTYYHLAEHLGYWYADQGNEAEAEKAAIWGHDVAVDAFPDDRRRGVAEYNLGCFYAKRGQVDKAMPHLERGLGLRPDLKEYARSDADLDPIRAELTGLLA